MNTLILTVGLPRSGKSTWAKETGYPIVNPDSIRLAIHGQRFYEPAEPLVWATAKIMVQALFKAGHTKVVLDATNLTKERRAEWRSSEWVRFFLENTVPKEVCIERAITASDEYIVPIIERMASTYEPVNIHEELTNTEKAHYDVANW